MTHATMEPEVKSGHVTPERLMQFAFGYAGPLLIHVAVKIGAFDALDKAPMTAAELSASTSASERGIRGLLNGLTGLGIVNRRSDGKYALAADTSAFLVRGKPGFHGGLFLHMTGQLMPNWMHLEEIVCTGKPAKAVNTKSEGSGFFEQFVESLIPMSYPAASALACHLGLEKSTSAVRVLDIAAGSGAWGIALAQSSPNVTFTAVDWPNVLTVTKRVAERFGVSDRLATVAGDLLEVEYGGPYHVATLGHILHSEGPERSRTLLKKVHAALARGGVIAIGDFVVNDDRTGPPVSLIFSVNMLVNTDSGDTYTFSEIRSWLDAAGFVDVRHVDAPGPAPLILAQLPQLVEQVID